MTTATSAAGKDLTDISRRLQPRVMRAEALSDLDALFRSGRPPEPPPRGFLPGELITMSVTRPTDGFVRWVSGMYMPWRGKSFDPDAQSGINILEPSARSQMKVLWRSYEPRRNVDGDLEAFPFRTRIGPGRLDPQVDVLKIDYDFDANPDFLIRHILDELVQIDDDLYLGKILYRLRDAWHAIGFFSLTSAT